MSDPWPLPVHWRWERFGDVARVASNLVDPAGFSMLPHIAPNHIQSEVGRLLPYATVGEDGVTSSKHRFRPGQILYSKIRPYLAKVVIVDFEGLCSADMYPIETELDSRYLKWWMLTREFTRRTAGEQARTILPKINREALMRLPVPVAPPADQRRIVEILEDHLSRLDAAAGYASAAAARLSNVDEASLRQQLAHVASKDVPLGKALSIPLANGRSVPTRDGGFPVLRLTALQPVGVDLSARKGGAWSEEEARRFLVAKGDYLIARGNGSIRLVGRGSLVRDDPDPIAFPDTAIRARPNETTLSTEYLDLVWNSRSVRLQIESMARTTAGIYKVNQKQLASVLIPVPSLPDQAKITRKLAETREQTASLIKSIEHAQGRALSLRRALLAAAFSGKLTGRHTDDEVIEELAEAMA